MNYKYIVKVKDKVVFETNCPYKCATRACNENDWRNCTMETNNESATKEWVHMKYNKSL